MQISSIVKKFHVLYFYTCNKMVLAPFLHLFKYPFMKRLALLLPWFSFFLREKYTQGFICLALQITIIGWPIASLWATITLLTARAKQGNMAILQSLQPSFYTSEMAMQNIA